MIRKNARMNKNLILYYSKKAKRNIFSKLVISLKKLNSKLEKIPRS
jgi:hypothetical protein